MAKKALLFSIDSIFLIIFNLFFFLATGADHVSSVWIAYIFMHFSYIMLFLTPLLVHNEKVFSLPVYLFSSIHFFLQLAVAIVFTVLEQEATILVLIINIAITAVYLLALFSISYFNQGDVEKLQNSEQNKAFISECSAKLKDAYSLCEDKKCAQLIDRAYYTVHSSPIKSIQNASGIEIQIMQLADDVYIAVKQKEFDAASSYSQDIIDKTNERNRLLKSVN